MTVYRPTTPETRHNFGKSQLFQIKCLLDIISISRNPLTVFPNLVPISGVLDSAIKNHMSTMPVKSCKASNILTNISDKNISVNCESAKPNNNAPMVIGSGGSSGISAKAKKRSKHSTTDVVVFN